MPTTDGTLAFGRHAEDVGDQDVAAGIEQRERLGERVIERNEEQALAEQNEIVASIGLEILKPRLEDVGASFQDVLCDVRQHAVR